MYHHIANGKGAMYRSPEKFERDLENLYKMGFRPVTMTEYVQNKMKLAPGASPVVMTFDDAHPNQFKFLKDGSVDPKSGVGIWMKFAKTHPDFPVKGTWYVLPNLWGQEKFKEKKIKMLLDMGSEIGNHTVHHKDLKKQSDEQVKAEIGKMNLLLQKLGIGKDMPFAPPYGSYPRNLKLVQKFSYAGKTIEHSSACLAGSCPGPSPEDKKHFNPYKIPRLHGNGRELGIDDWLNMVKKGQCKVYVAK